MSEAEPLTRSFDRYLTVLRRQWRVTIAVTIIALAAAVVYVAQATPVYSASSKIVVGQNKNLFNPTLSIDYEALTSTISNLLQSNVVASRTITDLHLRTTPTSLLSKLNVTALPDGAVIDVSYDDTSQVRAKQILGTVDSVFTTLLNAKLSNAGTSSGTTSTTSTVSTQPVIAAIFDPAHADPGKVSPHTTRSLVIALVLGIVLGILLAFIKDGLSSTIESEDDAEAAYGGIPIIGNVPRILLGKSVAMVASLPGPQGLQASEAVRMLTSRLRYSTGLESGVIVVVSAESGEGKSTVAGHLSAELARSSHDVIAVEGDLHRPALHRVLGVNSQLPGLSDLGNTSGGLSSLLVGVEDLVAEREALGAQLKMVAGQRRRLQSSATGEDQIEIERPGNLRLLPAGVHRDGAVATALSAGRISSLLLRLRAVADYVVIDTPPLLLTADAYPLVQMADLVVVVVRRGQTRQNDANRAREAIESLGAQRKALVLTDAESQTGAGYYGYPE